MSAAIATNPVIPAALGLTKAMDALLLKSEKIGGTA